ncbi:MAG: hypothetical protein ACR2K2_05785 [Mycobacteriales bacterium]
MADDVQLTDLEVIQRYSLAVRGATASRAELVQALKADLDWLTGNSRRTEPAPVEDESSFADEQDELAEPPRRPSPTRRPSPKPAPAKEAVTRKPGTRKPGASRPTATKATSKRTART